LKSKKRKIYISRKIPFALPPLKERPVLGGSLDFLRTAGSISLNISESKTSQQFQFFIDFRIKEPLVPSSLKRIQSQRTVGSGCFQPKRGKEPVVFMNGLTKNRWFLEF
jgi:hypothetical protein